MPLSEEEHRLREAIAVLREKREMSQRHLSTLLGWHPMTIGKIERGERGVAVIELISIAYALNTTPVSLLESALDRKPSLS